LLIGAATGGTNAHTGFPVGTLCLKHRFSGTPAEYCHFPNGEGVSARCQRRAEDQERCDCFRVCESGFRDNE